MGRINVHFEAKILFSTAIIIYQLISMELNINVLSPGKLRNF